MGRHTARGDPSARGDDDDDDDDDDGACLADRERGPRARAQRAGLRAAAAERVGVGEYLRGSGTMSSRLQKIASSLLRVTVKCAEGVGEHLGDARVDLGVWRGGGLFMIWRARTRRRTNQGARDARERMHT